MRTLGTATAGYCSCNNAIKPCDGAKNACLLDPTTKSRRNNLLDAMSDHILAGAKITGKYRRG